MSPYGTGPESRALQEAMDRLLSSTYDAAAARADDGWPAGVWKSLAEMGVPGLGIPEERGGSGGLVADAALAVRVAAGHAVPLPIAETALLAGWALARAGLDVPEGAPLACAVEPLHARERDGALVVSGTACGIAWASHCEYTVGICEHPVGSGETTAGTGATTAGTSENTVVLLRSADARIEPGSDIAGEARDRLTFEGARPVYSAPTGVSADLLLARAAAARAIAVSGAADRVLGMCVEHARTRQQFGKPIGAFQAVAHLLARIAGASVAAQGAAALAVAALEADDVSLAGAAKTVASEAAGTVAELAHQVHGAIGMTREHDLHRYTRRLWAWRDEYGSDRYWARRGGAELTESTTGATRGDPWHDLVRT